MQCLWDKVEEEEEIDGEWYVYQQKEKPFIIPREETKEEEEREQSC